MATQVVARDDGRIGGEMTLKTIAHKLDEIGTQISSLDARFSSIDSKVAMIDAKVTALDTKVSTIDGRVSGLDGKVSSLDGKVSSLDGKVSSLDGKVSSVDGKVDALANNMKIEFEETRRLIKLGFESTQMLREETGRRFDDTDRAHTDHKSLIESAVTDLRRELKDPRRV